MSTTTLLRRSRLAIGKCENCGRESTEAFGVALGGGKPHIVDCPECAMQILSPKCFRCGSWIAGDRVEIESRAFCSLTCSAKCAG